MGAGQGVGFMNVVSSKGDGKALPRARWRGSGGDARGEAFCPCRAHSSDAPGAWPHLESCKERERCAERQHGRVDHDARVAELHDGSHPAHSQALGDRVDGRCNNSCRAQVSWMICSCDGRKNHVTNDCAPEMGDQWGLNMVAIAAPRPTMPAIREMHRNAQQGNLSAICWHMNYHQCVSTHW